MANRNDVKYRSRWHLLELYPDNELHAKAIEYIIDNYSYACACHNLDTNEDGSLKKLHYHFVLHFDNPVWNTGIAKALNVEQRFLENCKNVSKSLRYLVHADHPDKYQYENEIVFGDLKPRFMSLVKDKDEGQRAMTIFNIIKNCIGPCTYTYVFTEACNLGLYADFRKMGSGVVQLIKEHNRPDIILGDF